MSRTGPLLAGLTLLLLLVAASLPSGAKAAQTPAVQAHLMWARYDSDDVSRQMDEAKAGGARMLRVDVGWASLEKNGKGNYDSWYLGRLDAVVDKANARGLKLLLTFWETPCWASTAPETLKQGCGGNWWDRGVQRYGPANPRDYGDALEFLARRYRGRLSGWEIWNEPNHVDYLKSSNRPATYAGLVKAAYPAAKRGDPHTPVLAGSLADADYSFTESLYNHGVKGHFDAWSIHPYSEDRSPLHPGHAGWESKSFISGVPRVRNTLLRHGDDKPIWLTEFGWSTCNVRGDDAWDNCVDEGVQQQHLTDAFAQMQRWSYVPVGVWFNLEDTSADRSARLHNYGLLRHDGSRKPAFGAFRAAADAVAEGRPVSGASSRSKGRIRLRVYRRKGRVYLRGRARGMRTVTIRAYRFSRSRRRYSRRGTHRRLVRVSRSGAFKTRIRSRSLRRGKWKFVAKSRRRDFKPGTARLR